jgi:phytoene dehydrogenase-like protein
MCKVDAVVIGAGHNGLTCACYLAKAGLRVLVLERAKTVGGMSMSKELVAHGFLSDVHASGYLVAKLSPAADELGIAHQGLKLITPEPNWAQIFPDGHCFTIGRDIEATCASMAKFSQRDGNTWRTYFDRFKSAKPRIMAAMNSAPADLAAELDAPNGPEAFRFTMQSARSWVNETFESPQIRLFFASAGLHAGLAPDDALGANFAWMFMSAVQDVGVSIVEGGMHRVSLALADILISHGGVVRTDAEVRSIEINDKRAVAVHLRSGERIAVEGPIAVNTDPRHLVLDLLGEAAVGSSVAGRIRQYEWGPSFFGIYLALDRPISFKAGAEAAKAGYIHACEPSLDRLAQNFVDIRAGRLPINPMVGIINESAIDRSRAPAGKALMKFIVHFVPYRVTGDASGRIAGTDWDTIKDAYADTVLEWLDDAFLPGLRERTAARSVWSPLDYERDMPSAVQGTHQHGAYLPYQIGAFRPIPEMGRYRSPVGNVYLCGAGAHPGSGVSMCPGRNAAAAICHDLALSFPGATLVAPD